MTRPKNDKPIILLSVSGRNVDQIAFWLQKNVFNDKIFLPYLFHVICDLVCVREQLLILPWHSLPHFTKPCFFSEQKRRLELLQKSNGRYFASATYPAFNNEFYDLITEDFDLVVLRNPDVLGLLTDFCLPYLPPDGNPIKIEKATFAWSDLVLESSLNFMSQLSKESTIQLRWTEDRLNLVMDGRETSQSLNGKSTNKNFVIEREDPLRYVQNRDEFLSWYENSASKTFATKLL